jgi:Zn-dependent peptidase ImmA (M78 family)
VSARGFKSWCENVALQQRRELKLKASDPLDAWRLAGHLGVTVWTPEQVPGLGAGALETLLEADAGSWSAVTLSVDTRDLIILNSAHTGARPASNLMHELAHILIGHAPARVDVSENGLLVLSTYNRDQEAEATWLAGTLLLPREALMFIRQSGMTSERAMKTYGVSREMLDYRFRMTGVDLQLRRARR